MEKIFGFNEIFDYSLYIRGIMITLFAIILFRANLSRLYGNHSPLDFIIYIIVGAILGEAIVNNIPLVPSIIVTSLIVCIYRCLAWVAWKSHRMGKYIKGDKVLLVKNGKYVEKNLRCCRITCHDILQTLRIQHSKTTIHSIKDSWLERDGQISFIFENQRDKKL